MVEVQVTEQDQYTLEGSLEEEEDLVVMEVVVEGGDVEEEMAAEEVVVVVEAEGDADSGKRNVNVVSIIYVR